jgi:single-stranded-DNA-specific exonuclease
MEKIWQMRVADEKVVTRLCTDLGVHPLLCRLMTLRGLSSFQDARQYFRPRLEDLPSPWLMKGMETAVERILTAIHQKEQILIYGDYDADGTTAVSLLLNFLGLLTPNLGYYIPHRQKEGYGLSRAGIDHAYSSGATLLLCLDCGIRANDMAAYAQGKGIDLIICDHHLPDHELPVAISILNPKQDDCPYPGKELTGCGISFKLACAIAERVEILREAQYQYLDLVALSIAADIVPVTGENRILAFYGLKKINESPTAAFKALIEVSGIRSCVQMSDLAFLIAPRINAAGRMDDARRAVSLFTEPDQKAALILAAGLQVHNNDRKHTDELITREALALIESEGSQAKMSTVVYQPHWHRGVVGIVASRLTESYYRPTIVLTRAGDMISGSARSVPGFNIYEAIRQCADLLEHYGGHFNAAGITLRPENLDGFKTQFELTVTRLMDPSLLVPRLIIDGEINLTDIKPSLFRILKQFEPSGPGNEPPVFMVRGASDSGNSRIVGSDHIRFELHQSGLGAITGIGFGLASKFHILSAQKPFDLVCTIDENLWNGHTRLQLKVNDIRESVSG